MPHVNEEARFTVSGHKPVKQAVIFFSLLTLSSDLVSSSVKQL